MRTKHVDVEGASIRFKFQGKSGKRHMIGINDRRLAAIIKRCLDLPGYELFQYVDDDGTAHSIDSSDVNEYLRTITEQPFTAKDFRTWAGTVLACLELRKCELCDSQTQAKKNIVQAIKSVAERLGNTPAVCRKCYVHPHVVDTYLEAGVLSAPTKMRHTAGLLPEEVFVLALLRERAKETDDARTTRQLKQSLKARKKKAA
jgi:DNA topoisomerase-1